MDIVNLQESQDHDSLNRICTDKCDVCGKHATGVLYHHNGTPVLFGCKECHPTNYEAQAKAEIESWLAGDR